MHRQMIRRSLAAVAFTLILAATASAQQVVRVRGTVERVESLTLVVKTREGPSVIIKLADNYGVTGVVAATLADIKAGSYVGIAALPQPDGTQRAIEVLIFPEALRGFGEGFRPWDLVPQSTMTNATVAEIVTRVDGARLTLKYKDGEKTGGRAARGAHRHLRAGGKERAQARRQDFHRCRHQTGGRDAEHRPRQRRPRRPHAADVTGEGVGGWVRLKAKKKSKRKFLRESSPTRTYLASGSPSTNFAVIGKNRQTLARRVPWR